MLELRKHRKASVELIDRAHKPPAGNTAGTANETFGGEQQGHPEEGNHLPTEPNPEGIRNQLTGKFIHSLHTQLSPARLCPWLHIADDLGITNSLFFTGFALFLLIN